MGNPWLIGLAGIALALLCGVLWRRWRIAQLNARMKLAMLDFVENRDGLAAQFLQAANATGKPRGLHWKDCQLAAGEQFARDRVTGELYALVAATICFEAIEGGAM
jgi:hypothetical protein